MHVVLQPDKSRLCGQACVAMLADISLEKSIDVFGGRTKGTNTAQIAAVLRKLGFSCPDKLVPLRSRGLPDGCICKMRRAWAKRGNWHWVIHVSGGTFYDPSTGVLQGMKAVKEAYPNWEITSYLAVQKVEMSAAVGE